VEAFKKLDIVFNTQTGTAGGREITNSGQRDILRYDDKAEERLGIPKSCRVDALNTIVSSPIGEARLLQFHPGANKGGE
jgi:hypothetical protein